MRIRLEVWVLVCKVVLMVMVFLQESEVSQCYVL